MPQLRVLRLTLPLILMTCACEPQQSPPPASQKQAPARVDPAPDLVVSRDEVLESATISSETFSSDHCAVVEGCVTGPGARQLLRFTTAIRNVGEADWKMGDPAATPEFVFSPCHGHYHLAGVMRYELRSKDGSTLVQTVDGPVLGRKQSFCLRDDVLFSGGKPGKFDCENQGITAGWTDVYDASLDCQWIDVTGVAEGDYTLRQTVNPDGLFPESDRSNNTLDIPVRIPAPLALTP